MLSSGKMAFWILATGLAVVLVSTFDLLPPVVASHFDASGVPNGWSGRGVHSLVILTIGVGLPLVIVGLVRFLTRRGPEGLNIPARDYWTRPEHGREAVRRVRAYTWWLGGVMAGTALLVHVLVLAANRSQPPRLRNDLMYLMLAAVLPAIGGWALGWYRLLRPPRQAERKASGAQHRASGTHHRVGPCAVPRLLPRQRPRTPGSLPAQLRPGDDRGRLRVRDSLELAGRCGAGSR